MKAWCLAALLLVSCMARGSFDPTACSSPPCEVILTYTFAGDFPPAMQQPVREGASMWNRGSNGRFCVVETPSGDVEIAYTNGMGNVGGLYSTDMWGNGTITMSANYYPMWAGIAAHEFGHALGARHTDKDTPSIMHLEYDQNHATNQVYPADVAEVCLQTGKCSRCEE